MNKECMLPIHIHIMNAFMKNTVGKFPCLPKRLRCSVYVNTVDLLHSLNPNCN